MSLPRELREEKDPEILHALLECILHHVNRLEKEVQGLRKKDNKAVQLALALDDQLLTLRKRIFGKSSEKRETGRPRDKSKVPLSIHSKAFIPPPTEEEMGKLTEIKVDHKLSAEDLSKIAEEYGFDKDSEWECLNGFYDESEEVDIRVESYIRKKHRRFKYRLKATKGGDREVIVTAPTPIKIMPGAKYSTGFAVDVVSKKYLYHLPFERIRRILESGGLKVSTNTLYNLSFFVHCYLEDIAKTIKEEILRCGLIPHMDETPWPIGNKKQSDGYMWVMSNQGGSFYQFEPTRSGAIAKELIGSYRGPVLVDGYGGYKSSLSKEKGVDLAFCWAHVRRKFTDIESNYPNECSEILDLIGKLFHIEKLATNYDELEKLRQEQSKPLVDKIRQWLFDSKTQARSETHLLKAINYTMNHWEGLTRFLQDICIPLTNNEAERTIRHSVIGRKNFYGSRTINGADVTATLYTVIESCKKAQLDPKNYILMAVKKKTAGEKHIPTPLQ